MTPIINLINAWSHVQYETLLDNLNKKIYKVDSEISEIADTIRNNGVAVIENYYSEEKCDAIIAEIDRLVVDDSVNLWQDDSKSDSRVYGSHIHSELIREFHNDDYLKQIGQDYLQTELVNSHTLGARLVSKEHNLGSGGGWHRDSVYKKQYKSIVYLTDVDEQNGPFEFLLKSHQKTSIYSSIIKNGFKAHQNRMSSEEVEAFKEKSPEYKSKVFTAKRGSVVLVDTSGIHRGMPIQNGSRYALTNYFFPKHHYTESQKKKFEKLL